MTDVRQWARENAALLTSEDWDKLHEGADDDPDVPWADSSITLGDIDPSECRALLAHLREVAEALSHRMYAGLLAARREDGSAWMLAASLRNQLTEAGFIREREAPDGDLDTTPWGRAVARYLGRQQGGSDAG